MRGGSSPYKDNEKSYLCSWNEKVDPPCLLAAPGRPVDGGLRNLTLNATALCRLSLLNHIQTEQGAGNRIDKVRYNGQPALSPALQAGPGYTFGRSCFLASVEYDRFGFQGIETNVASEHNTLRTKVRTQGVFNDLTVQGKVQVRF